MKLSEAAQRVIDLAGKVRDYYEAELPKLHPNYPLVNEGEEEPPAPPEQEELRCFLSTLSAETIYQLMLLMYFGRGEFRTEEFAEHYEDLKKTFTDPQYAASQVFRNAALAENLAEGLEELLKHGINVDKMPLKKAKARKS